MTHADLIESLLPVYAAAVGIDRAARAMSAGLTWTTWMLSRRRVSA